SSESPIERILINNQNILAAQLQSVMESCEIIIAQTRGRCGSSVSSAASNAVDASVGRGSTASKAAQANELTSTIDALYDDNIDCIYAVFLDFTQHKGNKRYTTHRTNAVPVAERFVLKVIQSLSGSGPDVEFYNKLCTKYKDDQHETKSRNQSEKRARREEASRAKELETIRRQYSGTSTSALEAPDLLQLRATRSQTRRQSEHSDELEPDEGRSDRGMKRVRISDQHTYHDDE
ncbi:hypothetical protein PspLS_01759, partial [Pyricularia sp. CBS 133598]